MKRRRIVYIQYTNPAAYPPLEHSSTLLADDGWEVLFLGIRKHEDPPLDWPPRQGICVRQLSPSAPGWRRKLHYLQFALWVAAWVVRWRPAWVYASDALACPIGVMLSFFPGLNIVYHEHDAPQVDERGLARGPVLRMRRWLAGRASGRVLPNMQRAEQFKRQVANHRPTFSVWNCPSREEVGPARSLYRGPALQVLYVGSIVPFRLPTSVIEALSLLPDEVHLRMIGYTTSGHSSYVRELRGLAEKLGLTRRIEFVDGMPHQRLLATSREADVGLVLMPAESDDGHAQWMPGASNKPFDYLACGLALLVADCPGWRELVVEPRYGVACEPGDPRSIAAGLRWFLDHTDEMRAMGELGRKRVLTDWNYETQFAPVREWFDANCYSRPRTI
jgi:glycosyltransferase involved in cell wall biosynthesis